MANWQIIDKTTQKFFKKLFIWYDFLLFSQSGLCLCGCVMLSHIVRLCVCLSKYLFKSSATNVAWRRVPGLLVFIRTKQNLYWNEILKQADNFGHQYADFLRFHFTEVSLKIRKGLFFFVFCFLYFFFFIYLFFFL